MSTSKKRQFKPQAWETIGGGKLHATLFASMMQHEAYLNLSAQAAHLYSYMKLQYYGVKQEDKPEGDEMQFVFNRALYKDRYKLFKNGEQFNKYCHELIKHGFIEQTENGRITRTKNIYRFSNKWNEWKEGDDFRPPEMQKTDAELLTRRRSQWGYYKNATTN